MSGIPVENLCIAKVKLQDSVIVIFLDIFT